MGFYVHHRGQPYMPLQPSGDSRERAYCHVVRAGDVPMNDLVAWSYSRLEGYETCPRKFWRVSIKKDVQDPPNEHTTFGTELHLAFANYLHKSNAKHKPLPLHLRQHKPMLDKIKAAPGEHVIEQQLAITAEYKPTGWFDKDVYCRVISDLTILNSSHAVMFDWKSGKKKDDFTQLRVAAAVMFLLAEELETISMNFVWTKSKEITTDRMTRDEMPSVWSALHPRLIQYQNAFNLQQFEARQGFHCRYCPVRDCPYNERRK